MPVYAWFNRHGLILGIFIAAILLTDAYYLGDTADYVSSVLDHIHKTIPGRWDPLWDFGHVLWRPAGLVAWRVLEAISPDGFGLPPHLLLTRAYIAISIVCGAGVVLLLHSLTLRATRSRTIAVFVASAFLMSNAVLNYTQTGNAYIAGLFFLTLGVWVITGAAERERLTGRAAASGGLAMAGAALCWFPYVFVLPAAALIPMLLPRLPGAPPAKAIRFALVTMITAGLVMALIYGAVIFQLRISSITELKDWVLNAGHGQKPGIVTNSMRLVFGIPRAFIELGDDGKLIKRYLFHDPYAPTSVFDVLKTAAAPLVLFYSALGALLWAAARSREGRQALWIFVVAAVPVIFFAVVVFEAGAPERYLPFYPFLALAIAYGLAESSRWNAHRYLAAGLFAVIAVRSGFAMSHTRAAQRQQVQAARISYRNDIAGKGVFILLNYQDDLMHFVKTFPFHPLNRPQPVPIYSVFEPGTVRINTWRQEFAGRVVRAWDQGGDVWVSKRFIAARPLPAWNWVEGEDTRISWAGSRDFFRRFQFERESGGDDGFVMLKRSEANRGQILQLSSSR